jgi:hypothetical protein
MNLRISGTLIGGTVKSRGVGLIFVRSNGLGFVVCVNSDRSLGYVR